MAQCTGKEILTELLRHLGFDDIFDEVMATNRPHHGHDALRPRRCSAAATSRTVRWSSARREKLAFWAIRRNGRAIRLHPLNIPCTGDAGGLRAIGVTKTHSRRSITACRPESRAPGLRRAFR